MNGRVSKLLRKTFIRDDTGAGRQEYRNFKRAYAAAPKDKKEEVIKVATKIKQVRDRGGEVKTFHIDEKTHQMIPDEEGGVDERPTNDSSNAGSARHRKGDKQEKSK